MDGGGGGAAAGVLAVAAAAAGREMARSGPGGDVELLDSEGAEAGATGGVAALRAVRRARASSLLRSTSSAVRRAGVMGADWDMGVAQRGVLCNEATALCNATQRNVVQRQRHATQRKATLLDCRCATLCNIRNDSHQSFARCATLHNIRNASHFVVAQRCATLATLSQSSLCNVAQRSQRQSFVAQRTQRACLG
jgi:hypothetical protein